MERARVLLSLAFLATLVVLSGAEAVTAEDGRVRARLVTDAGGLVPGDTVHVGVELTMEPGWHVYWINPGDAGLSTEVILELPEGFEVGPIEWPVPISFVQPGDIAGFGYEGTVTLATQVRVPDTWGSESADLRSSVSWLACKHVCVVGSAKLDGRLPDVGGADAFKGWRDRLPRSEAPFFTTVTGGLEGNDRRAKLSVWLQWADPPGTVEFFPVGGERLKAGVERVATRGDLTRIDLAVSVVGAGASAPDSLTAVVAADGIAGARPGWQVTIPIRGANNETDS